MKKPVGERLALGALHATFGKGSGSLGGFIKGCALSSDNKLTLSFTMAEGRALTYVSSDCYIPT